MPTQDIIESPTPVTPSSDPSWNESHAAWWFDREQGIGGFHRLAHQPNRGTAHAWHCLMGPNGSFRRMSTTVPFEAGTREGGQFTSEQLTWRYHGRGGADISATYPQGRVELTFQDHQPAVESFLLLGKHTGKSLEAVRSREESHFEAAGVVTGQVELGDRRFQVDAMGYRDHSWGPRHLAGLQCTNWLVGTTGPDLSICVTGFVSRSGRHGAHGFVVEDGQVHVLTDSDISYLVDYDGVSVREGFAEATSETGKAYSLRFRQPLKAPITAIEGWMAAETICSLTVNGREGVGLCERTFSTCGGSQVPAYTSNGLIHEGFLAAEA